MTISERIPTPAAPTAAPADYDRLAARFRPIFARIAEGAVARERARILPVEPIRWLVEAGFASLRVPRAHGGEGLSLVDQFRLVIELAEADSNVPQALRAQLALVEDRLNLPEAEAAPWFARFVRGEIFGSAWTEPNNRLGLTGTTVTPLPEGGYVLQGRKSYSTGTIYADWIDTFAQNSQTGEDVIALVPTSAPGVTRIDDWAGFGQRTTGSGTTIFEEVRLTADQVVPFARRFSYQTAFYQLVLNATQAGIARAVLRDALAQVRARKRNYSHSLARLPAEDPQIQQVIGRLSIAAFTVEAATLRAAEATERAAQAQAAGQVADLPALIAASELAQAQAQAVATDLVPRAATELFNVLGASGTDSALALDRHWRNARTIASHNPVIYKERLIGDHLLNGKDLVQVWQVGSV